MGIISNSLRQSLREVCQQKADQIAVQSPDGRCLTFEELWNEIALFCASLEHDAVGTDDVILVRMTDGFDGFVALLSAMCHGVALPVPAIEHAQEIHRLSRSIKIGACIFDDVPADWVEHADREGIKNFTYSPKTLGLQRHASALADHNTGEREHDRLLGATDKDCLFIRTGGTISAPKLVAINNASLLTSVQAMKDWANLDESDVSLCLMPRHHLHAIHRSTLPVLLAGGTVILTDGPDPKKMASWVKFFKPTFITATPTILRALAGAVKAAKTPTDSLAFVASGSAPLRDSEKSEIENALGTNVQQFYGLTETAPFLTVTGPKSSAPSVGKVVPPWEISFAQNGQPSPGLSAGEIAVRGGVFNDLIIEGARQAASLTDGGWLLTGDLGKKLPHGEIELFGRVTETINKAGVKTEPLIVESAALKILGVDDCVCFGHSDLKTNEMINTLLVCGPSNLRGALVRDELREMLPLSAMPDQILLVQDIPRQASGKISRPNLSELLRAGELNILPETSKLQQGSSVENEALDQVDPGLRGLFMELLEIEELDPHRSFFDLGGDSFLALQLILEIENKWARRLSPSELTAHSSLIGLSKILGAETSVADEHDSELVCINEHGDNPPLYLAPMKDLQPHYSESLPESFKGCGQPLYAFDFRKIEDLEVLSDIADRCIQAILKHQPIGPYAVCGFSFGAHVALEMASMLKRQGHEISLLLIVDDYADLHKRQLRNSAKFKTRKRSVNDFDFERKVPTIFEGPIHLVRGEYWKGIYKSSSGMDWEYLAREGVNTLNVATTHSLAMHGEDTSRWAQWAAAIIGNRQNKLAEFDTIFTPAAKPILATAAIKARELETRGKTKKEIRSLEKAVKSLARPPGWMVGRLATALISRKQYLSALVYIARNFSKSDQTVYLAILYCQFKRRRAKQINLVKMTEIEKLHGLMLEAIIEARIKKILRAPSKKSLSENLQLSQLAKRFGDNERSLKFAEEAHDQQNLPITSLTFVDRLIGKNMLEDAEKIARETYEKYPLQKEAIKALANVLNSRRQSKELAELLRLTRKRHPSFANALEEQLGDN